MNQQARRFSQLLSSASAAVIAIGTCIPATVSFADPTNIANQSTTGTTNIVLVVDEDEYGGTAVPEGQEGYNPAGTSGYGSNLAFTAPTELDFVARPNGELLCPSATAVAIENKSVYGVHVSALQIENETNWSFVANAATSTDTNAVSMNVGPAAYVNEKLSFAACLTKQDVNDDTKWGMSAKDTSHADQLNLVLDGKVNNLVNAPTTDFAPFGYMHWYLASGGEGTRYIDPAEVHTITKTTENDSHGSYVLSTTTNAEDALSTLEYTDGDPLYVIATPDTGYAVYSVTVTSGGESVSVTTPINGSRNLAGFIMPDGDATVTVNFQPIYDITAAATTHGTYKVSNDEAGENTIDQAFMNDTVYVVANPRTGYENVTFAIETVGGTAITPTAVGESGNVVSFTMPAEGVNVGVAFADPKPALTAAMFANNDLIGIKAAADYITGDGTSDTVYINAAKALVGQTVDVALNDGQGTMTARLVSVDNTRGLTFEAVDNLTLDFMNETSTNTGGWAASALRTSMNSGTIYTTYFSNSALTTLVRQVSNTSYSYGGGTNTSTDYYWIPSANNIFGPGWYNNNANTDGDAQFDYYAALTLDSTGNNGNSVLTKYSNGSAYGWWLRSASCYSEYTSYFMYITWPGKLSHYPAHGNPWEIVGVAPCFCL